MLQSTAVAGGRKPRGRARRHKQIALATLAIGMSGLIANVVWIFFYADASARYGVEDFFLIVALLLIMGVALLLMLSADRLARVEIEWQHANTDLEASQARLQAVVKHLPVGVVVASAPEGELMLANDEFERLFRHRGAKSVASIWASVDRQGRNAADMPHKPEKWPLWRTVLGGRAVLGEEIWIERGDGTYACLSFNASPILDAEGRITSAAIAFNDVTERKEMEEERMIMARRLVNAQEDERLRISRELHDEMGQDLTGLSLTLKEIEQPGVSAEQRGARLAQAMTIVEHMSVLVHRTASKLRPTILNDLGLQQALGDLVASWGDRLGITADSHLDALAEPLDDEGTVAIYRVVQESLTNVAKHSGAHAVSVTAQRFEGMLRVAIEDDGKGFDPDLRRDALARSFGLSGMRERLELVGGRLAVESAPGKGTTVYASIPTRRAPAQEAAQ